MYRMALSSNVGLEANFGSKSLALNNPRDIYNGGNRQFASICNIP